MIIDIIPCVVVTSLETDAFMAIVAHFDMLMVTRSPARGRRKRSRRNDDVQEFDTRWDEILLSMTKIPSDDILESLYTLRIRESDQLKTVLEMYDMDIHQKISMPNE